MPPTTNSTIDAALAEARAQFIARNPHSARQHAQAAEHLPGGNTRTVLFTAPFPLTFARGAGCRLWDADGHEYVDYLGEYTAGLYGHDHPAIRAAVERALDGGWNLGGQGAMEAELAALIRARFPSIELVRFTNSGTEANLMALALATAVTGRRKVLVFNGGYHGGLLYFGGGGMPLNVPHEWVVGDYNDSAATRALIAAHGDTLAAIIVEPMLGSGGCLPARSEFLAMLRAEADRSGAVLVFDEVMTSRMSGGGQQERLGLRPDLTTLGKYIGGGMSFGAFGGRRDLMERFDPRREGFFPHAGTFNNNVFTMHAGVAGMGSVFTPAVAEALFARGEALRARLNEASAGAPLRWTGLGSLMCAQFQHEPPTAPRDVRPDGGLRELLFLDLLARGCYLARRGMIALSLALGAAEEDRLVEAVTEFVAVRRPLLEANR